MNSCGKDQQDTDRNADQFVAVYRSRLYDQSPFECYYNTADSDDVIAVKVYSRSDVIHSMLWPSLVIVVCCVIFLRIETRRRHLTACGRADVPPSPPPTQPPTAGSRRPTQRDILDTFCMQMNGGTPECRLLHNASRIGPGWSSTSALNVHRASAAVPLQQPPPSSATMSAVLWKSYSSLDRLIGNNYNGTLLPPLGALSSPLQVPVKPYVPNSTATAVGRKSLPIVVVHHLKGCSSSIVDLLATTTAEYTINDDYDVGAGEDIPRHHQQPLQYKSDDAAET